MPTDGIPSHVRPELVRDVDIYGIQTIDPDIHRAWKKLQDESPALIWSPTLWWPLDSDAGTCDRKDSE